MLAKFLYIFGLTFGFALPAAADETEMAAVGPCPGSFGGSALALVPTWSEGISARSLLPASYLQTLSQNGRVRLLWKRLPPSPDSRFDYDWRLQIKVGRRVIFSFIVSHNIHSHEIVEVSELSASHFLMSKPRSERRAMQDAAGQPGDLFLFIMNALRGHALAAGVKTVRVSGANNYLVFSMYQRRFNLRISHPEGQLIADDYERLYYSGKIVAKQQGLKFTRSTFSHLVGTAVEQGAPIDVINLWSDYLHTGQVGEGMILIGDANKPKFVRFAANGWEKILYVRYVEGKLPMLYDWAALNSMAFFNMEWRVEARATSTE